MAFSKNFSDYLVEVDVTNYKQLSPGDIVAVTEVGWNELKRKKAITIGAAVGAVTVAAACSGGTAFGALGSGAFGGMSVGAEVIAAVGVGAGASLGYGVGEAYSRVESMMLGSVNILGRVIRIDQKALRQSSEDKFVEVKFYIPQQDGSIKEKFVKIDAHHLYKMISKEKDQELKEKRKAEIKQKTDDFRKEVYDQAYTAAVTNLESEGLVPKSDLAAVEKDLTAVITAVEKDLTDVKTISETTQSRLQKKEEDLEELQRNKHDSEVGHWIGHLASGFVVLLVLL